MSRPRKRVVTMTGAVQRRNFTVHDLIMQKGKSQLVQIMAFTTDEAAAAEAAGLDMINIRWNAQRPEDSLAMRHAAPETFMTFCLPPTLAASPSEALRAGFTAMEAGADSIYCAWSMAFVETLAAAGVPVMGHVGLVPRKSTWTGGLRAVGKTLAQARAIHRDLKALENAGAWAAECEVVPHNVMALLARHTGLVTISLGSGPDCDVQHLFGEDVLGTVDVAPPRHAKNYTNFHQKYAALQKDRIAAFATYAREVREGVFPAPEHLVSASSDVLAELETLIAADTPAP